MRINYEYLCIYHQKRDKQFVVWLAKYVDHIAKINSLFWALCLVTQSF